MRKRASASDNARSRSRKSGVIWAFGLSERMELEAQLPDELSAIIDWNAVPVERVGVSFGLAFTGTKHANLCLSACATTSIGVRGGSRH